MRERARGERSASWRELLGGWAHETALSRGSTVSVLGRGRHDFRAVCYNPTESTPRPAESLPPRNEDREVPAPRPAGEGPAGDRHRRARSRRPRPAMLDLMYTERGPRPRRPAGRPPITSCSSSTSRATPSRRTGGRRHQPGDRREQGRGQRPRGVPELPGLYQDVRRAKTVKVQAYNLKGEAYEMICHDLPARVWQHEIDHLNGVLFIDKMGPLGRHREPEGPRQVHRRLRGRTRRRAIPPDADLSTSSGPRRAGF